MTVRHRLVLWTICFATAIWRYSALTTAGQTDADSAEAAFAHHGCGHSKAIEDRFGVIYIALPFYPGTDRFFHLPRRLDVHSATSRADALVLSIAGDNRVVTQLVRISDTAYVSGTAKIRRFLTIIRGVW